MGLPDRISFMFGLGSTELIVVLIIVLVLFGGRKIPELMSGVGKGIRSFKKDMNEEDEEADQIEDQKSEEKKNSSDSTS